MRLYVKVEQHLRMMLSATDYAAGDRIPSERDLAAELGVNRLTVRRAVANLVAAGLLETNGTGGTRVARPRVARPVQLGKSLGIDRMIAGQGGTPGNRLVHFELAPATAPVAELLDLAHGAEVVIVRRVFSIDSRPFCVETSHLPAGLVPGLAADDLVAGQSLYALLRSRYGHYTENRSRSIGVAYLNPVEARLLEMTPGAAALALRLLVQTLAGQPIEYTTSLNNPDLVTFRTGSTASV